MNLITVLLLSLCVFTTAVNVDRKHRVAKIHHQVASHSRAHAHAHAHVKGTPHCILYTDEEKQTDPHTPEGSGFRICQYVDHNEMKICTEETEWSATALHLTTPLKCTLGTVVFTVWHGTYEGMKIIGAREVQGPSLYAKGTWSWRAGTATDCVGFFLGLHWKTTPWTNVADYTAYATRITGCYVSSSIQDQAKNAAIAIFSSVLGACGPVGDVLNIIFTIATQIPGVVDPKNNDILHSLAVCEIGTILHERCNTVISGYSYTSPQTLQCKEQTVSTRTAVGQYSFKGVSCANTGYMNGDLFFKIYSGTCGGAGEHNKRLTTGTGILDRVCDGGEGFDYQLPDWSTTRTFDPSGGMCVQMFDSDIGSDDYLCQVEVSPVLSEGSFAFDCMWDSDRVQFTLNYQLVPKS
jgi:hypothetical protein